MTGSENKQTGEYDGYSFRIVHLYGHILGLPVPEKTAKAAAASLVGKFSNIQNTPWHHEWFDFSKRQLNDSSFASVIDNIRNYLRQGYIPVIASDIDESGEGDLLVREVLNYIGYSGKTYREYHVDEAPASIKKSMKQANLKVVGLDDPKYRIADARSNMDFMTQQLTRVATIRMRDAGYELPKKKAKIKGKTAMVSQVVPVGRLKSVIIRTIGDQEKAIKAYKPSTVYESRYKLGDLLLTNKDMPRYKTKEEWKPGNLPKESAVKEVKQTPGRTLPPKAYVLSQVAGEMSKHGVSSAKTLKLFQAMYEACYLSYPRTEDDFVSPEQFKEATAQLDDVLRLLELPSAPFTHRQPRHGYVKEGASHGALRWGSKLPESMAFLTQKFGPKADVLWKIVATRFVQMYLEDTKWIRYTYQTTDTPVPFEGTVKVITSLGAIDPSETEKTSSVPDLRNKATLMAYPIKSVKPTKPTPAWLYTQLKKDKVGTGATRVSTVSQLSGKNNETAINEGKILTLSPLGWAGYYVARQTQIGSVEGTQKLQELLKAVEKGGDTEAAYTTFDGIMAQDVEAIKEMDLNAMETDLQKKEYAEGNWNGEDVRFNRSFGGYRFSDDEVERLLNGESFEITGKSKSGNDMKMIVKLAHLTYNGYGYVGIKAQRAGYHTISWHGQNVTIKGSYMDHIFTDEEVEQLANGETIKIETHKDGKTYNLEGKLEEQAFTKDGKTIHYVGFKAQFPLKPGYNRGVWRGKEITFKGEFMGHKFTPAEIENLLADHEIEFEGTSKKGKTMTVHGKLANKEWEGHKFVGFEPDFD